MLQRNPSGTNSTSGSFRFLKKNSPNCLPTPPQIFATIFTVFRRNEKAFRETFYFVALINPGDQWHPDAIRVKSEIAGAKFVTTEIVLIEVLSFLSEYGETLRHQVSLFVRDVLEDVEFDVIPQSETTLLNGLDLYESRLDKGYSLPDCILMNVCDELGMKEILTHDGHFEQEV